MTDDVNGIRERTVIVGAAQGIGKAVAELLGVCGHELVLADVEVDRLAVVASDLRTKGAEVRDHHLDLADTDSIATFFEEVGAVTGLVSTAAVMHSADPLTVDPAQFEKVLKLNLIGNYALAQAAARSMISHDSAGSIVVVTSAAARRPHPNIGVYAASKAAVTQALRVLGLATQPYGIRINTVAPTATRTEMLTNEASYGAGVVPAYVNDPDDIANAIAFLLSPASRAINLREVPLDGGTLLGL